MKRFFSAYFIVTFCLLVNGNGVQAEVTQEEVENHIQQIGLSYEKFQEYLAFHEVTIDEFETLKELDEFIGTPINAANLDELLSSHDITKGQLDTLLARFGETIDNYLFIEDLTVDVQFYLEHAETILESERLLSDIGLSTDEVERLFNHILSLDRTMLEDELTRIGNGIEPFISYNTSITLTTEQYENMLSLYDELMEVLDLSPTYYLVNNGLKQVTNIGSILGMDSYKGQTILVELADAEQVVILDMEIPEKSLSSDFLLTRGEQLINVAALANERNMGLSVDKLPKTASPYGRNMIIAILTLVFGVAGFIFFRPRRVNSNETE